MSPKHLAAFLLLGSFWGLSPSFYKLMAEAGVPVTHAIVYSGAGVGLGLSLICRFRGFTAEVWRFAFICAALMNIPFALSLTLAHHVPPTEYALITSTAPIFNYCLALATGKELADRRRLLAIAAGFVSSGILVLSREGMLTGGGSYWTLACFLMPLLWMSYNWYAARGMPAGAGTMTLGAAESFASAIVALPFMLWFAPPWGEGIPGLAGYWALGAATLMWVAERISFFTLMRDKGSVYTVQAIYVATPAAVLFGWAIFGTGVDAWLLVSLAVLMLALWLNNSGRRVTA